QLPESAPRLHAWHVGHDAVEQHTALTQLPLAHCAPPVHAWPFESRQLPIPSHAILVLQPVCGPAGSGWQAPAASAHVAHAPHALDPQHVALTQKVLAHCGPIAHGWPCLSLHAPVASHVLAPVQVSGSSAPLTG